jgi:hypothetical protein
MSYRNEVTVNDVVAMFDEDDGWMDFARLGSETLLNEIKANAAAHDDVEDFRVETVNGIVPLKDAVWVGE